MYRNFALFILALACCPGARAASATFVPWPADAKLAAVESCKQTVRDNVASAYLTMTSSTELPPDFYQNAAPNLNPLLVSCDCAIDKLAKQISFDYYTAHPADMTAKLQGFKTGSCTPQPPQEAEDPDNSSPDKPGQPETEIDARQ